MQALLSLHSMTIPVPLFRQPADVSQVSAVQTLTSSHAESTGALSQPVDGSHVSVVQVILSSQSVAEVSFPRHVPAASPRQASPVVQASPSLHVMVIPLPSFRQPTTVSHVSSVQAFSSSHTESTGALSQPVEGSHVSVVQLIVSSQSMADVSVPSQVPAAFPTHASAVVQALPSIHSTRIPVPSFRQPAAVSQVSAVQTLLSSHAASTGVLTQPSVVSKESSVHGIPSSQSIPETTDKLSKSPSSTR